MTKNYYHTKKWKRCVKKVQKKEKNVNPFAVCTASLGKKESLKKRKKYKPESQEGEDMYYHFNAKE